VVLSDALKLETASSFRTAAQCQGRRRDGSLFLAQTWFSTYETPHGRRLAAIAVDLSDETREREEQNLRQLLDNNRIIAGAVSHEIRNVCSAISLVYANLRRMEGLTASEDFHALGSLVEALENIAATELQAKARPSLTPIDLHEVLNHLRIVIEPNWEEIDGHVQWEIAPSLPAVMAEPFGLTQAFLNLAQNSHRAVQSSRFRRLRIRAASVDGHVEICFEDSGPGVREPDRLFQPFQRGAAQAGLGLYVSRAILRSYGGDLRYEPRVNGCCFVIHLPAAVGKGATAA
jgi:signal transduction histidine kinase